MKNLFIFINLFTVYVLSVFPSNAQQAFYVYRNDGRINTFITTEVDSMTYSCFDIDYIEHGEYVVHEIFTPDSVYRIPLELIDSVGFVTPETVYKPNVKVLDGELRNYIISRDELTLYFQSATPRNILPHVGDKLVTTESDDIISNAFVGMVSKINYKSNAIEVVCTPVDLTDVFECYYGIIKKDDELVFPSRSSDGYYDTKGMLSPGKLTFDLLNTNDIQVEYSPNDELLFGVNNANAVISVTPAIKYNAYTIINKHYGVNVSVDIIGNYSIEELIALSGKIEFGGDVSLLKKAIPIPEALVDIYFEFGVFNNIIGEFSFEQKWEQKYRHVFHWEWSSKGHKTLDNLNKFKPISSTHSDMIALNGSLGVGVYGGIGIAFIATSSLDIAKIGLRLEGGLMIEGTCVPYKKDMESAKKSTDLYNKIKDTEVISSFYYGLSGEANLFNWSVSHEIPDFFNIPLNKHIPLARYKNVPIFSNTRLLKNDNGSYYASVNVEGIVNKTDIGFALINDYNYKDAIYSYTKTDYQGPMTEIYSNFFNVSNTNKYTVYPLVKYMGMELIAEPSASVIYFHSIPDSVYFQKDPNSVNSSSQTIDLKQNLNINVYDSSNNLILNNLIELTEYAKDTYGLRQEDIKLNYTYRKFGEYDGEFITIDENSGILYYHNIGATWVPKSTVILNISIDLGQGYKSVYKRILVNPF